MPTFNQLVNAGRKSKSYKSSSPALQTGMNTLKKRAHRSVSPAEARCLHRGQNHDAEETELCSA